MGSIVEQRQIFKGADHAFLWKPKLRIPDIYESAANQRAFGQFLDTCVCCTAEGGNGSSSRKSRDWARQLRPVVLPASHYGTAV